MDFEKLFVDAMSTLIDINGGSLETAMDDIGLNNKELREQLKEYFEWEEEEEEEE